jgi:hypothetical protein
MLEFLGRVIEILVFFAMIRSVLGLVMRIFRGTRVPRTGGSAPPIKPPGATQAGGPASAGASEATLLH